MIKYVPLVLTAALLSASPVYAKETRLEGDNSISCNTYVSKKSHNFSCRGFKDGQLVSLDRVTSEDGTIVTYLGLQNLSSRIIARDYADLKCSDSDFCSIASRVSPVDSVIFHKHNVPLKAATRKEREKFTNFYLEVFRTIIREAENRNEVPGSYEIIHGKNPTALLQQNASFQG